ncbi:MAG TPA: type II secretion system F family protein [Patescibacteria group bacterium]|nr:type II secretion system F family protein [Patescibacteria group bacterium]
MRESTLVLFLKFDKKISPFKASRDFFYVKLSKNREVDVAINKMTTMMEPLMIVVMAVVVGFVVIAMLMPMFDMLKTV